MPDESVCRVLIVDNELEYAAQTAAKLAEIRPSLLNNNRLQIELTNNAYFAAERLRSCPAGEPPWDVIISDVYMPFPCQAGKPDTPELESSLTHYQTDGKAWRTWEFPYPIGELDEKVENGGFHIAETIAARLGAGEDMPGLKMILMSNCLEGADRDQILLYQETRSSWLKYYDKANWRRNQLTSWPSDQLTSWPKRQSPPNVFQWALVRAIAERHTKDWGQLTYERYSKAWGWLIDDRTPDVQAVVGDVASDALNEIVEDVRRFGEAKDIQVILITGEVGTGREVFAKLIHNLRMKKFGGNGEFVALDCSSISQEAFERALFDYVEEIVGGTLFIDEVDKLTPPHQGKIYHLLKEKKLRSVDRLQSVDLAADLAICTASSRNLEELNLAGLFHDDLYYLLRDEQLHVNPLRERPADAVSIAEVLAQQSGDELKLSADAREWIAAYHWPGNNKELRSVITAAARRALTAVLTADDLETVLWSNRRIKRPSPEEKPIRTDSQALSNEASKAATEPTEEHFVFRLEGEIWNVVYEGKNFKLNNIKGLRYIACLLREPGREFSVQHFTALTDGLPLDERGDATKSEVADYEATSDLGNSHLELDPKALRQYAARLKSLNESLEIAQACSDTVRIRELKEEIDFIKAEFAEHAEAKRPSKSDIQEKTRTLVYNNYHRALDRIINQNPHLGLHLKNSIRTGRTYSYQPDLPLPWAL